MPDSSNEPACPVCKNHTAEEAVTSQGVIITGIEAIMNRDDKTIEMVYESLSTYDAHVAITLLAQTLADICEMAGASMEQVLLQYRQDLNAEA